MARKCILCGKEYEYCPSCPKDAKKETWYAIYDSENCKDISKALTDYNLKKITFRGLRHTNVTLMIAKGIQTQIISRKVGHSSVQTTDRVYSHFFEDEFKNVPNVMEEFLTVKAN